MNQFKGPAHLAPECTNEGLCRTCAEPVKQSTEGGWFITMGHAGFNTTANNRSGYKTRESALRAFRKCNG